MYLKFISSPHHVLWPILQNRVKCGIIVQQQFYKECVSYHIGGNCILIPTESPTAQMKKHSAIKSGISSLSLTLRQSCSTGRNITHANKKPLKQIPVVEIMSKLIALNDSSMKKHRTPAGGRESRYLDPKRYELCKNFMGTSPRYLL